VAVLPDGRRLAIPPPAGAASAVAEAVAEAVAAHPTNPINRISQDGGVGVTRRVALGRLVFARSGDKGGAANVGVWVPAGHPRRAEAFGWLRGWLDAEAVRRLLPEAAGLAVAVHPLPNLSAVNVVVDGLLGDGVAASTRFDPQAKAVGEWLRARHADIPEELIV
jgi:hypothetical protein